MKVPEGAWFTLMLATVLSSVVFVWRYGTEHKWRVVSSERITFSQLVEHGDDGKLFLSSDYGGNEVTTIKGKAIASPLFRPLHLA